MSISRPITTTQRIKQSLIKNLVKVAPLESTANALIQIFPRGIAKLFSFALRPPESLEDVLPYWLARRLNNYFKVQVCEYESENYADAIKRCPNLTTIEVPVEEKLPPMKAYQYTPNQQTETTKGKCLVFMNGNCQYVLHNLLGGELSTFADTHGVTCVSMDYRGKADNKLDKKSWVEFSTKDDVHDQQALINQLIQSGYKPEDITLVGFSLGSQVAIWTAFDLVLQRITQKLLLERVVKLQEEKSEKPLSEQVTIKTTEAEVIQTLTGLAKTSSEFATMLQFYQNCNTSFSDDLVCSINALLKQTLTCEALLNSADKNQPAYEKINVVSWNGFAQLRDYSHVYEREIKMMYQYFGIDKNIKLNFFELSLAFQEMGMIPQHYRIDDAAAFLPRARMFRVKKDDVIPGDGPADLNEPSLVKTVLQRYPELKEEGRAIALETDSIFTHDTQFGLIYFNQSAKWLTGDMIMASIVLNRPLENSNLIDYIRSTADADTRLFLQAHNKQMKRFDKDKVVKESVKEPDKLWRKFW